MTLRAIDFESYLIGENAIFPKPVCVSSHSENGSFLFVGMVEMEQRLRKWLKDDVIIAHNMTFECGIIVTHFPHLTLPLFKALEEGRIICTMIREQHININRENPLKKMGLSCLVDHYFKVDISETKTADSWRMRYSELDGIKIEHWPKKAIDYAIDDSVWAYKIYKKQIEVDTLLSMKSSVYLNLMAAQGMGISQERVMTLKKEIMDILSPHYNYLIEQGFCTNVKGKDIPRKNMKKLKEHIEVKDIDFKYTAKGSISVTGEALEFYQRQEPDEVLQRFADIGVYEKVLSAFVRRMEGNDTMYSSYSTVMVTGRTSSSGSSFYPSLNIQQLPRGVEGVTYDLRNCFVPPAGFKILSIDYAGLELSSTAHQLYSVYGKSKMRDVVNGGDIPTDMHSVLAAYIQKISYDEFISRKKELKHVRTLAKPINLGFPGGLGFDTMRKLLYMAGIKTKFKVLHKASRKEDLVYLLYNLDAPDLRIARLSKDDWGLVQDELVQLKRMFFKLYPELEDFLKHKHKDYIMKGSTKWTKNEYDEWELEDVYKYKVGSFERSWCTYTAFCNGFLMQSPAAQGAKAAVSEVYKQFYGNKDMIPKAFIHDEILFYVRENREDLIEKAAYIMIDEMQKVLNSVRITVEASLANEWTKTNEYWDKKYWRNA